MPQSKINFINKLSVQQKLICRITDDFNLMKTHGITNNNLVNLSGGLPVENITSFEFKALALSSDVMKTEINCDKFITNRTIDFEDKTIYNDYMKVNDKSMGIGIRLFLNQAKVARGLGFSRLSVHAAGGVAWDIEIVI